MFNGQVRKAAVANLKDSVRRHTSIGDTVVRACDRLYQQRLRASGEVLGPVSAYVSSLANAPHDFDRAVDELRLGIRRFEDVVETVEASLNADVRSAGRVASAAAAGVGVAAFGPTLAMAVATTFGTASTGTAISALSGAAATNAALAWLGGGAIAAGGSGVAGGAALLALAGPVGWGIGGTALLGSGMMLHFSNRRVAEQAEKQRVEVESEIVTLIKREIEVRELGDAVQEHADGCLSDLAWLSGHAPSDYHRFTREQKDRLAALINHTRALGEHVVSAVAP